MDKITSQLSKYVNIGDDGTWTLTDEGIKEMKNFHSQYGPVLPPYKTSAYNFILMELYSTTLNTNKIMECGIGIIAFFRHTFMNLKTDKLITHPTHTKEKKTTPSSTSSPHNHTSSPMKSTI